MNFNVDDFLEREELSDFSESFEIAKYTSAFIDQKLGRQILIHVLDIWKYVNTDSKNIWINLIERAGFYPYLSEKNISENLGFQASIRREWYKSDNLPGVYFHAKQKVIEREIANHENVAVSAPTSFGKSLLIEEIVARNIYLSLIHI